MEESFKNYVPVAMCFQSSKEKKFTDEFHKFHIPLRVKKFFKKK